jgi:oligopeptidase B
MECGMNWWKEGKMLKKKNTFLDYISCAEYLIKNKYTKPKQIIGMGGSAGGLLMGAVLNQASELFLAALLAVPFVDSLTTNLDHSLPLTVGEFKEFGNAKKYKKHFEYIKSYAPYNNIKKQNYPHIFVTTSLFDNRVLYDEPTKYVAKLRQYKKDNNILLLKTEMNAGHGGKTGRDASIEELAQEFSFILKVSGINT